MTTKPATKEQLIALRDVLLAWKDKDTAAAVDNVVDLLGNSIVIELDDPLKAVTRYATCPQCKTGYDERFTNCLVCNSELIRPHNSAVDVSKYFGVKATATKEWARRHLNPEPDEGDSIPYGLSFRETGG